MYRFQIKAFTNPGESIGIVGSTPELGSWDVNHYVPLTTTSAQYPLWRTDSGIKFQQSPSDHEHPIEYKYIRLDANGDVQWEAWGANRWLPRDLGEQSRSIIVDDGEFGYIQPYPYGFDEHPTPPQWSQRGDGLKIVVIGSSVALGHQAWLMQGWATLLAESLHHRYGHSLVNVSELGANVTRTIERFPTVVAPEKPDVVIIALSLGNEGLASCLPHERRAVQRRFESGLQRLVRMTRELGAYPVLGGVYPHGNYNAEQYWLLKDTHQRMLTWDVPLLNWLSALDDGNGHWRSGISFDPAHPNAIGHRLMYEAIDLHIFQLTRDDLAAAQKHFQAEQSIEVYADDAGFRVIAYPKENQLRIINTSPYTYKIAAYWQELQLALRDHASLVPGIYIAKNPQTGLQPCLSVNAQGEIETLLEIPPGTDISYASTFDLFSPDNSQVLFYDGHLGMLKENDQHLRLINESDHEFNIHPMWQEVRSVLKAMPPGVYEDVFQPEMPFRTMMISSSGLESRVKVPPKTSILLRYVCKLSDISRVAIVPLGARCAARMLLYKMEYDGPAYPFDLTRTTNLGDVADMIAHGFDDMWNPRFLHYNADEKRIYHSKWTGLSFAHEVEEHEDPIRDMSPVHARMRKRYQARAARFWYTLDHADKLLFVRNGFSDRGTVIDLMEKLASKCQGKPFSLLLLTPQPSTEYEGIPNVIHYDLDFDPDRMYNDLGYWLYCTDVMRGILDSLGISSKNLFWCPPNP
ncbi:MAG: DUF1796 family putative cysteine peptidase [Cyanobacteria bacterium]|nr:DUF1796 family putative cysteine peptidase [Cyanobacteriota bacterium]MDW8199832.1 DUF1796 family putative cysteine peptidase [Cyanobacteriota bacterium SKYGB_h_bin112]